jgi:hypothetical protein
MLTLAFRLVLLCLLLAFIVACNPSEEEDISQSAPIEESSGQQILDRANDAAFGIRSLKIERVDVSRQFAELDGFSADNGPTASYSVDVAVENDSYGLHREVDSHQIKNVCGEETNTTCLSRLVDLCRGESKECVSEYPFPFDETLWYGDGFYHRNANGEWSSEKSGCDENGCWSSGGGSGGAFAIIEYCGLEETPEAGASSGHYTIFLGFAADPEYVGEDTLGGETLLHVRGSYDRPSFEAIPGCPTPEESVPAEFENMLADRSDGTVDLWIDPVTFYLRRLEWHMDEYRGDRHLWGSDALLVFSHFNEATLPGPLPNR